MLRKKSLRRGRKPLPVSVSLSGTVAVRLMAKDKRKLERMSAARGFRTCSDFVRSLVLPLLADEQTAGSKAQTL